MYDIRMSAFQNLSKRIEGTSECLNSISRVSTRNPFDFQGWMRGSTCYFSFAPQTVAYVHLTDCANLQTRRNMES